MSPTSTPGTSTTAKAVEDDDAEDTVEPDKQTDEESSNLVDAAPTVGVKEIFRRFWPETKGLRFRLALSLVLVALGPALDTVSIYLFKVLVDDVFTPQDFSLFPWIAAAYLAITVVEGVLSFIDGYLTTWIGEKFLLRLRTKLFAHLHKLSLGFFERRQLGDVLSRLTGDIAAIEGLVLSGVGELISHGLKIFFFGGMLFWLNWKLALLSLVAAPLFALTSRYFSRRIKKASREKRRRAGAISAVAEESLSNVALVQAYDRADDEVERFHKENLGSFRAQMVATRLQSLFGPIIDIFEVGGILLVMGFAVSELASGALTLGGLLVFVAYLTQLYAPVRGLGELYNSIYSASASAERIIELLDEKPLVDDPEQPVPMDRARGALTVEQVDFAYPGTQKHALADVSFAVAPGQKIAVVGASGAGKSSLAKLMLRTYDPDTGAVRLDGIDLRNLALSDLRRNVTAVLQETLVFDGTVRDNILWGRPDATEEQLVAAAKAADAHDYICSLPEGYDTRVGQRGRMLSGGQRQRLAIARAMIRDAPVLLLDEPTTGLDAASTQRVLEPLRRLMAGRTTIIISHNLLTVTDADKIVYLEAGRVTGLGSHEELLATHAGYAELYRLHQEADEADAAAAEADAAYAAVSGHGDGDEVGAPATTVTPAVRPRPRPGPRPLPRRTPAPGQVQPTPHPRRTGARPAPAAATAEPAQRGSRRPTPGRAVPVNGNANGHPVNGRPRNGTPVGDGATPAARMVDGGQIVDAHLPGTPFQVGSGGPVTNGQPVTNGRPATNGQPVTNGRPATNGHAVANGQPVANGRPVTNGQPVTDGRPATNGHRRPENLVTEGIPAVPSTRRPARTPAPQPDSAASARHRVPDQPVRGRHSAPGDDDRYDEPTDPETELFPATRRTPGRHRTPAPSPTPRRRRFAADEDLIAHTITQAIPVARAGARARSGSAPRPLLRDHA